MDICSVQFSSDLFTVHGNKFIQEMSTLQGNTSDNCAFGQVYDDAADVGFVVVSKQSGIGAVFVHAYTERDREGEIVAWKLIPTQDTLRRLPSLIGWTAIVLND